MCVQLPQRLKSIGFFFLNIWKNFKTMDFRLWGKKSVASPNYTFLQILAPCAHVIQKHSYLLEGWQDHLQSHFSWLIWFTPCKAFNQHKIVIWDVHPSMYLTIDWWCLQQHFFQFFKNSLNISEIFSIRKKYANF